MNTIRFGIFTVAMLLSLSGIADEVGPKYGPKEKPHATLLQKDHSFIQKNTASDFWSLMPYYEGMRGGHSASAASVAMVINALKRNSAYTAADELLTEESLLKKVTAESWAEKLSGEKPVGVNLSHLATITKSTLALYGVKNVSVKKLIIEDASAKNVEKIRKTLVENEAGQNDFIIANYIQSAFTGDPEGAVGTYSVVAAFDAETNRVLVFETDRKYYEAYWVPLQDFAEGISGLKDSKTKKVTGGLLFVH